MSAAPAPLPATVAVAVEEASQVGGARRAAAALAAQLEFGEAAAGRVALIATEAATNLARHATGGVLLVQPVLPLDPRDARAGVELVAVDRGPGIRDLERASVDGYSTGGTAGQGLGAMRRAADAFDVYSVPARVPDPFDPAAGRAVRAGAGSGGGTIALARCWADGAGRERDSETPLRAGGVSVPLAGESVCGDAWAVCRTRDGCRVLVADGLGHGPLAAEASQLAVRLFRADLARGAATPLEALVEVLHAALRATRGAAVAAADVRLVDRAVHFVGVGNVAASIVAPDGEGRNLVSHNGTVGHQLRKVQTFQYPWPEGGTLVLATDGLRTQWRLADAPGLVRRDPTVVAAALWRDHARGRDDATAVVVRDTVVRDGGR